MTSHIYCSQADGRLVLSIVRFWMKLVFIVIGLSEIRNGRRRRAEVIFYRVATQSRTSGPLQTISNLSSSEHCGNSNNKNSSLVDFIAEILEKFDEKKEEKRKINWIGNVLGWLLFVPFFEVSTTRSCCVTFPVNPWAKNSQRESTH